MNSNSPKISVCLPVYNGSATIADTLRSILCQTFEDFELVVVDNASTDNTADIVKGFTDKRIAYYRNDTNIGNAANFDACCRFAKTGLLFYICDDDVADKDALKKVYEAFMISEDIGIVVRPYYWFIDNFLEPVRITRQFSKSEIVSLASPFHKIADVIALADQISGVGLRKRYKCRNFSPTYFIEMSSVVAPMLKHCKAVILRDNIVAVRAANSANEAILYIHSPMMSWYRLITDTFSDSKTTALKNYLIQDFIATNYIGLVQIKNYGTMKALLREIALLIRLRPKNIFNLNFLFFSLGTIIIPKSLLRWLVNFYKNRVNSRLLSNFKPIQTGEIL